MAEVEIDGPYDSKLFRALVVGALLSGSAGGISTLVSEKAPDRYTGAEAAHDWAEHKADESRERVERRAEYRALRDDLQAHLRSAETHIQVIRSQQRRIAELENQVKQLYRESNGH